MTWHKRCNSVFGSESLNRAQFESDRGVFLLDQLADQKEFFVDLGGLALIYLNNVKFLSFGLLKIQYLLNRYAWD